MPMHEVRRFLRDAPWEVARRDRRIDELVRENARLRADLAKSEELADRLGRQLQRALAGREAARVGAPTVDGIVQPDIADAFTRFIEQSVHHFARVCLAGQRQPANGRDIARLISRLSEAFLLDHGNSRQMTDRLLRGRPPAQVAIEPLVDRLYGDADELRRWITRVCGSHHWDFDLVSGSRLNPERQRPWGRCDPAHPLRFVVSPGLILDGRLYCKQRVYTASRFW